MAMKNTYLIHWGIAGMRWGIRRYRNEDGSLTEAGKRRYYKQLDKSAKKDAQKYVNAKQYYGEGAGTRRKLLKGELSKKMKDPEYASRFNKYVEEADYVKATNRAIRERHTRDTLYRAKVNTKKVLKVVGMIGVPVATVAGSYFYSKHGDEIDRWIHQTIDRTESGVKRAGRKVKNAFTKPDNPFVVGPNYDY